MARDSVDSTLPGALNTGLHLRRKIDRQSGIARYEIDDVEPHPLELEVQSLGEYYRQSHAEMTKPHRHAFYQVLWFCNAGSHFVDFTEYRHDRGAIFFIAKDQIHCFEEGVVPDGLLLHFNAAYLDAALATKESSFIFHLFDSFYGSPMVLSSGQEREDAVSLLELISKEYQRPHAVDRNDLIMCLLSALLILGHRCKATEERRLAYNTSEQELFLEFRRQLERDFAKTRGVYDYAAALGVSPQRLSEASRLAAGVPAKRLILERVTLEAKRLLCNSSMSVAEIAELLGYEDAMYFSRAFRGATGLSPRAFRTRVSR